MKITETEADVFVYMWVVVKIMVPFWGPYYNTAPII